MSMRSFFAVFFAVFVGSSVLSFDPAFADPGDWKKLTCPSASAVAIGTSGKSRKGLCVKNTDGTNDICVSNLSSFTCDGTVATDGFPLGPGESFCETENSSGSPAALPRYCRAESSDAVLGYKESRQ